MADPVLLKDALVWGFGYDLAAYVNNINLTASRAELQDAVVSDVMETFSPGLQSVDCSVQGFWQAGSGAVDPGAFDRVNTTATASPFTIVPPAHGGGSTNTAGTDPCYTILSAQFGYTLGGQHGVLLPFDLRSKPRSTGSARLHRGTLNIAKTSTNAATNGAALQLGAVASTHRVVGILHLFSGTLTSAIIQSDNGSGFATPTTVATFTVPTAPGSTYIFANGAIADDYFRVVVTPSGTAVFAAILGLEAIA